MLLWTSFVLALTALLPLINPLGTALVFYELVGDESVVIYRQVARRVAITTFGFLVVIEFLGSLLLGFFGISLAVVQVAGGLVITATVWHLLFERDSGAESRSKHKEIEEEAPSDTEALSGKIFYPFTFPITAGPGSLVVMLTLSARTFANGLAEKAVSDLGIALATLVLSGAVYLRYGYAPKLIKAVSPSTVHGILRVIAFILMCIGVQIAWNGISQLVGGLTRAH